MAIRVLKPGLATTVQDLGRPGYYHIGIPLSGGMDRHALAAANLLVGNEEGAAVLEAVFMGPELEFTDDAVVAITGAELPPKLTVGHGGCFGCIYSARGAGGYQMFGITPMPIYDPKQEIGYLKEFMVFFRPGDIVKWKPIDRAAYDAAVADVEAGRFAPRMRDVTFSLDEFHKDIDGYNRKLEGVLNGN